MSDVRDTLASIREELRWIRRRLNDMPTKADLRSPAPIATIVATSIVLACVIIGAIW